MVDNVNTQTDIVPQTQQVNPSEENINIQSDNINTGEAEGVNIDNPTEPPAQPAATETPTPPQPTQEEYDKLVAKLKEYELQDAEVNQLKQRLGVDNVDYSKAQITNAYDLIDNQAHQEYLKLCNKFGVDYRPEYIEESAKKLEETNPKAYWELRANLDRLQATVNAKKNEVRNFEVSREVNSFYRDYEPILNASPVISSIVQEYISTTPPQYISRQGLEVFMDRTKQIYAEAYNAGMQMAQTQTKNDPKNVLNTSVMSNQGSAYPLNTEHRFTRDEIAKMSTAEFAKNEKAIMAQMAKGLI